MIKNLLQQIGFNKKEVEVYLTVLKYGKILPAEVAKVTGIKRTTVYSIAKELIKRGIITEDLGGASRFLIALPPSELANLVKKEQEELSQKKLYIQDAVMELESLTENIQYAVPKISFIPEGDLIPYLYKSSEKWNQSVMEYDGIWWGFQDTDLVEKYEEWLDWFWDNNMLIKFPAMKLHLLSNKAPIERKMAKKDYDRRVIKVWKQATGFTATTWVCGDYLLMMVTQTTPHYLLEIHDKLIAHNMRELFKGIWKGLK